MKCPKCTLSKVKYFIMAMNCVLVIFAIGVIAVNVIAVKTFENEGKAVAYLLITSASLVFLIALCGCCGAVNESTVCMWTYVVFLLIIAIVNFIALCGFLGSIENEPFARKKVENAWKEYEDGNERPIMEIQAEHRCCGKIGPENYANKTVPVSCRDKKVPFKVYFIGCYDKVENYYIGQQMWVRGVTWTASVIECVAVICGVVLALNFPGIGSRESF